MKASAPPVKLQFDRRVHLELHGATITSDAALLACRELDNALGLRETATACLQESRGGRTVQHRLLPLLTQSVDSRLAGYENTNPPEAGWSVSPGSPIRSPVAGYRESR